MGTMTTNKLILHRGDQSEFFGCFGREFLAYRAAWELINADESITSITIKNASGQVWDYDVTKVVS